ncbi:hypothetical protein FIC_00361 [Flavobacteriaceae bacterium 3519-10]|nr:hypothetical protein FIC_00361 [Flavobacteriaceae bacterium 3519-10]
MKGKRNNFVENIANLEIIPSKVGFFPADGC